MTTLYMHHREGSSKTPSLSLSTTQFFTRDFRRHGLNAPHLIRPKDNTKPLFQSANPLRLTLSLDEDLLLPSANPPLDLGPSEDNGPDRPSPCLVVDERPHQHQLISEPALGIPRGAVIQYLKVLGQPFEFREAVARRPLVGRGVFQLEHPHVLARRVGRDRAVYEAHERAGHGFALLRRGGRQWDRRRW